MSPQPSRHKGKMGQGVTADTQIGLAHSLAHNSQNDPRLAQLLEAWPGLPAHLQAAIMAIANAWKP